MRGAATSGRYGPRLVLRIDQWGGVSVMFVGRASSSSWGDTVAVADTPWGFILWVLER